MDGQNSSGTIVDTRYGRGGGIEFPHILSYHELSIVSTTAAHGGQGNANLLMYFEVNTKFGVQWGSSITLSPLHKCI